MPRLLFEKVGNAVYISHLDLMRLFQRAFKRAGLPLTHSGGFSPRPQVSIALPLSVGMESQCELLDFALDCDSPAPEILLEQLNQALIPGVRALAVYDNGRKIRELALLRCRLTLHYDHAVSSDTAVAIRSLFQQEHLLLEKKSKNGTTEQDIIPLIRALDIHASDISTLVLDALICCQNPSLNPGLLATAIERELPACRPDFVTVRRLEVFDCHKNIFR